MKIAVLSDTHGLLRPEAARRIGECDAVIHAGDFCTKEIWEQVSACRKPGAEFYAVRGNNDREFMDFLPESQSFDLGGFRFFLVHDIEDLPRELSECQIVIFGHSHKYAKIERDGRLWLNPGSCSSSVGRCMERGADRTFSRGEGAYGVEPVFKPDSAP